MKTYTKEEIKNLIDNYFEGNTSSKEEEILRNYFLQDEIDEDFLQYRSLFNALGDLADQPELMKIDTSFVDNRPQPLKGRSKYPQSKKSPLGDLGAEKTFANEFRQSRFKKYLRISATAIAGIAACFVLFFLTYHPLSDTFVIIDGKKYTDKAKIQNAFDASIENVRIDLEDVFSDLHDLVIEDD